MKHKLIALIVGLWCWCSVGEAQVVIEVVKYPPLAATAKGLFVAGDFNNWNPGDPKYLLKKRPDGVYTITLPDSLTQFEYKFTQGSSMTGEGNARGGNRPNRVYDRAYSGKRLRLTIDGWEQKPGYQFVIREIPANTPHDAKLFITGNFNGWDPGDENIQLRRYPDGTYRVTVYTDEEKLEYKFTRGDWDSVEGRESGKARPNRMLFRHQNIDNKAIEVRIESWEDLSGTFNFYSLYDLLLLFSAFQGLLLVIFIPTIQNYNQKANRWLVALIAVSSLVLLVKVVSSYRDVAQEYTKLLLLPDFIYFTYPPLFYIYIRKLLFREEGKPFRWWLYLLPAVLQVLVYLPFFFMKDKEFQIKIVNQNWDVMTLFLVSGFLGLAVSTFYWLLCRRTLKVYREKYHSSYSFEQNLQYLNTVQLIQAVCLVLWLFTFALVGASRLISFDIISATEQSTDLIWLAFSTIVYFLGYFAIHQPEIFKVQQPESVGIFEETVPMVPDAPPVPPQPERTPDRPEPALQPAMAATTALRSEEPLEDLQPLMQQVEGYMKRYKPYTNPSLTIHELSTKLKMQPHVLSKVINEGFEKNFFDFINFYRVEELKKRMDDPQFRNFTLLSLAYEAGFNSKTAFNRAFKKITQQTPSEYFNAVREDS
ncbi:helix-turn-helix domain-containing protein [Tellurirhabdus rosea]|uniref:helix-turn-helix domain-containing protein n=1 Tax=Tellurirhabdus rosea TaxID=2674997 RepID=UPI002251FC0A|nr:helix-turn-helix domain-containing protein [Tellurirhabdus rosea]